MLFIGKSGGFPSPQRPAGHELQQTTTQGETAFEITIMLAEECSHSSINKTGVIYHLPRTLLFSPCFCFSHLSVKDYWKKSKWLVLVFTVIECWRIILKMFVEMERIHSNLSQSVNSDLAFLMSLISLSYDYYCFIMFLVSSCCVAGVDNIP